MSDDFTTPSFANGPMGQCHATGIYHRLCRSGEVPPIVPLKEGFQTWQHEMDPERGWHCPELYAI